jgi:3',5'-cyclic AMP phosphodiesterase CpdA
MVYGWTGQATDPAIPFNSKNLKSHLISDGKPVKMLTIGDWGYLESKAGIYNRLDDAFANMLNMTDQPDVVYLAGDYAYDLSTNYGVSYENFLMMLSQISSVWPCIFMTGNHEYYTVDDFMLFNSSF